MSEAFRIPKPYTVKDVASLMEKSTSYVYAIIYAGLLRAKLRREAVGSYVISESDILDFLKTVLRMQMN